MKSPRCFLRNLPRQRLLPASAPGVDRALLDHRTVPSLDGVDEELWGPEEPVAGRGRHVPDGPGLHACSPAQPAPRVALKAWTKPAPEPQG